jgi:hypothetical protein
LERHGRLQALSLSPLTAAETASLAADLLGHELTPAQATQLFGDTEGNPLFVVETVRAEVQGQEPGRPSDGIRRGHGPGEATPGSVPGLPPKVRAGNPAPPVAAIATRALSRGDGRSHRPRVRV